MGPEIRRKDLIEPELSYKIVGTLFDVSNTIGSGHVERVYQRAVAEAFKKEGIKFKEQVPIDVQYQEKRVGKYFLDFLVEGRVIVELKQGGHFAKQHFDQVLTYLQVYKLPLAILANFTSKGVIFRRVLKPDHS